MYFLFFFQVNFLRFGHRLRVCFQMQLNSEIILTTVLNVENTEKKKNNSKRLFDTCTSFLSSFNSLFIFFKRSASISVGDKVEYYFIPKSWAVKCKKYLENGYTHPGKIPLNSLRCRVRQRLIKDLLTNTQHDLLNFPVDVWLAAMVIDSEEEREKLSENEHFVLASSDDWISLRNLY